MLDEFRIVDDVVHVGAGIQVGLEADSIDEVFGDSVLKDVFESPAAKIWLIVEGEVVVIELKVHIVLFFDFGSELESVVDEIVSNG